MRRKSQKLYQTFVMTNIPLNVVLDTNVILSAILFGGKPREILTLVQNHTITAYTSPILLAELSELLTKKFGFSQEMLMLTDELLKEALQIVYPDVSIHVVADEDDNRVVEAAVTGKCSTIITGDTDLLQLGSFQEITICTPAEFLANFTHQ